jgi:hypothetical protein
MVSLRRILPAIVLVVITPITAEYLLGDLPIGQIQIVLFVGPIYGFGALLIREVARQTGRGWPTMVSLAFIYGVLEEGVGDQTLFNPKFLNAHLLDYGFIPILGMGSVLTVFILSLHVIWSICTPIGLVELLFAERRTTPWLGKIGLSVSALGYVAGLTMLTMAFVRSFSAQPFQYGIVVLLIVTGLVVVYFVSRSGRAGPRRSGAAPSPWKFLMLAFMGTTVGMLLFIFGNKTWHVPAAVTVVSILALDAAALIYIFRSARCAGWSNMHRLALVAGTLLTYCWTGLYKIWTEKPAAFPSQIGLVAAFLVILAFIAWKVRIKAAERAENDPQPIRARTSN